jgi:ATP-dependent Lhr-like helicase
MGPIAEWLASTPSDRAAPSLRVLWITPLRALAADTVEALRAPLDDLGVPWQVRSAHRRHPRRHARPSASAPADCAGDNSESLSLLLTQPEWRDLFADLRMIVVDEWHELLSTKRGVQVELALARLRGLRPSARIWGLSATMGNLDQALDALLPAATEQPSRAGSCAV